MKTFTRLQNKFFEFRSSLERDIGAEDLKQDIFNELRMEELEKEEDGRPKWYDVHWAFERIALKNN